jgi:hypothetical protein
VEVIRVVIMTLEPLPHSCVIMVTDSGSAISGKSSCCGLCLRFSPTQGESPLAAPRGLSTEPNLVMEGI